MNNPQTIVITLNKIAKENWSTFFKWEHVLSPANKVDVFFQEYDEPKIWWEWSAKYKMIWEAEYKGKSVPLYERDVEWPNWKFKSIGWTLEKDMAYISVVKRQTMSQKFSSNAEIRNSYNWDLKIRYEDWYFTVQEDNSIDFGEEEFDSTPKNNNNKWEETIDSTDLPF